jgi:hypothetical protein
VQQAANLEQVARVEALQIEVLQDTAFDGRGVDGQHLLVAGLLAGEVQLEVVLHRVLELHGDVVHLCGAGDWVDWIVSG